MKTTKTRSSYQKQYSKEYREKNKRVNLTFTNREYKELDNLANKEEIKVATIVKNMAIAYMQQKTFVPKEITEELISLKLLIRNIANNVNQVAHHSNIVNGMINENDLLEELRKLENIVNDYTLNKLKKSSDY